MTALPVLVTDEDARAVAEDLGLGRLWKAIRDRYVAAGVWKMEGKTS